jgi:hypothetical protein
MSDEFSMAICAIRYCLGRSSYITSDGQCWAIEYGKRSPWVRQVIRRDLEAAVARCDDGGGALGMDMDESGWRAVLDDLQGMSDG